MKYKFTKMQGCGNDYIYFDCFEQPVENPAELSKRLSDRNFGVGGDGIILVCPSDKADAKMRIFNADGSEGNMCGNGIRCVAKFLYERKGLHKNPITVESKTGIKTLSLNVNAGKVVTVSVDMGAAKFKATDIPVIFDADEVVDRTVKIGQEDYKITCVSMGNPHCVVFGNDPDDIDLKKIGPLFEHNEIFPEQVNTEFVQFIDRHTLKMLVWERGSGETLACGTGACAVASAAVKCGLCPVDEDIKILLRGGELTIRCTPSTVFMTGPAEFAFDGEVEV